MPEQITIPKQSITIKETKQGKPITCFVAMRDGELISPCEAFGDKTALLNEAMTNGKPLAVEKVEFNEQWKRWNVWFPRGSGGEAGPWLQIGIQLHPEGGTI